MTSPSVDDTHATSSEWPRYFAENLMLGDVESPVAICTLWTKQERVAEGLPKDSFAVIGNLYSRDGINYLLRNILANPSLRYLILCGAERSGSGASLKRLFDLGVDSTHQIIDDVGLIEREIPIDAIDLLRASVKLIDIRGVSESARVRDIVLGLPRNVDKFSAPLIFPRSQPAYEVLPSEETGIVVRGKHVVSVWVSLLNALMKFGQRERTEYSVDQRELMNVVSVISEEDPDNIFFVEWLPFPSERLEVKDPGELSYKGQLSLALESITEEGLDGYYVQVLTPKNIRGLEYTYGQRLYSYGERLTEFARLESTRSIDQIAAMIDRLKESAHSRRALAVLWEPFADARSSSPPCLILVQAMIRRRRLFLSAYFRSHDIYRAWPENAFALRKLQKYLADGAGVSMLGDLTIVSQSAHIYEDSWKSARDILATHGAELIRRSSLARDERGSFVVRIEKGDIVVDHHSLDGNLLSTFHGRSAKKLERDIEPYISRVEHALYLGRELAKAEACLKLGLQYLQDRDFPARRGSPGVTGGIDSNEK